MAESFDFGRFAEQTAADYLIGQGYTVRERNWRIGNTIEIDIIAQTGTSIVFVEVKARSGKWNSAVEAVDEKKMKKMAKGADIYLRQQSHLFAYRFDIITITGTASDYNLQHYPDAFYPPLTTR